MFEWPASAVNCEVPPLVSSKSHEVGTALPHFHMCQNIDGEEDGKANSPSGGQGEVMTPMGEAIEDYPN